MPKSVYIHIPFCKSKCHYCSFVSFPKPEQKKTYLKVLGQEIKTLYKGESLNTLYFGGGTPSLLIPQEFDNLLKCFNVNSETEITAELNPDDLSYDYLSSLYNIGINRISIGVQSFDDEILKLINRRHSSKQVFTAVENAQKAGFKNISLDFIYGLPNQSAEMFYDDLKTALNLRITHISLYGLSIEENCYFYKNRPENLTDDDVQADMYLGAVALLKNSGFKHYEISNFAKAGFESKHNLNYWNNEEYYGFGVSAHGYLNGIRYGNKNEIEEYLKNPMKHTEECVETQKDKLEEEIFLGLRRAEGLDTALINFKYKIDFNKKYSKILNKYENFKLLEKTKNGYKLTLKGILVSNTILSEFID